MEELAVQANERGREQQTSGAWIQMVKQRPTNLRSCEHCLGLITASWMKSTVFTDWGMISIANFFQKEKTVFSMCSYHSVLSLKIIHFFVTLHRSRWHLDSWRKRANEAGRRPGRVGKRARGRDGERRGGGGFFGATSQISNKNSSKFELVSFPTISMRRSPSFGDSLYR